MNDNYDPFKGLKIIVVIFFVIMLCLWGIAAPYMS
jgi:hypothetical protein